MAVKSDDRGVRVMDVAFWLLLIIGAANFGWHALHGEFGVFSLIQTEVEIRALEGELSSARAEREALENLARRLSPGFLDLDLLDERARAVLGFIRSDEVTPR